nr:ABC transporter substrate-binding protein [Micromonospora sp. DSM 115978]
DDIENPTVAVVGTDQESARVGVQNIVRSITAAGLAVPYAENPVPQAGLNDATPIINELMRADGGTPPDLIITTLDFPPTIRITEALTASGYEGEVLTAVGYDPRLASFEGLQDSYSLLQWAPTQSQTPAMDQLKADFAEYAPDQMIGLTQMAGYWTADLFLDALDKTGRDLTVDNLLETLNGGSYTSHVEGALAETQWPLNHIIGTPCAAAVHLVDGVYVETMPLACGDLVPLE